jgi:hypothetical protein
MKTGAPETSAPDADEFLRMLTGAPDAGQKNSAPGTASVTRNSRNLEMLVRLIVRDELQHHVTMPSSDLRDAAGDENAPVLAPAVREPDNASDGGPDAEVMSAQDVAAFLGIDRNTVYDYAGRGTIPCRRLGKRLLSIGPHSCHGWTRAKPRLPGKPDYAGVPTQEWSMELS